MQQPTLLQSPEPGRESLRRSARRRGTLAGIGAEAVVKSARRREDATEGAAGGPRGGGGAATGRRPELRGPARRCAAGGFGAGVDTRRRADPRRNGRGGTSAS